jgi:ribonuclease HII
MLEHEARLWQRGVTGIAGIDEAGRGPLAGPVVAAAVVFAPGYFHPEVTDSKKLSPARREGLYEVILEHARGIGLGIVDSGRIDRVNILNATFEAMHEAVRTLPVEPEFLLVDGNRFRASGIPFSAIVDGDARCFTIAAASIVAKVTRDRIMRTYDRDFPGYGFGQHKGYGTPQHLQAIAHLGLCPIHRRSFTIRFPGEPGDKPPHGTP